VRRHVFSAKGAAFMTAWGDAPGYLIVRYTSAESAPSISQWSAGRNLCGAKDRSEITAGVNRAFSAAVLCVTWIPWGAAPGWRWCSRLWRWRIPSLWCRDV